MKIALAAATRKELDPVQQYLAERIYLKCHHRFSTILTGVGLMGTTYELAKAWMQEKPDIAIQMGIAGSFHPLYKPGMVVAVKEEIVGDLGVMEDGWMDLFDMGLADAEAFPLTGGRLVNPHTELILKTQLDTVRGLSVNQVSTDLNHIRQIVHKFGPVVESMEGAAFHHVCLMEGIPFIQIRAISNNVGDRNKSNWQIGPAIRNLNDAVIQLINRISE